MKLRFRIITIFLSLSFLNLEARDTLAGGFAIPHQTARGVGLSNAITAGVIDPSAVYYNPAALSEVDGNRVLVSGNYINVISSVENSGREADNKEDDNVFPTLFANYHIPNTDFTVGIGSYVPLWARYLLRGCLRQICYRESRASDPLRYPCAFLASF